jgi:ABC-2 type transport system ATP-binding protein
MSISIKNLSKTYGEQLALNKISLEIPSGQVVGFLGPNGAGKSTTMKIITCFLPQTEGTVKICGFDTVENPIEVKRRVGYLPENNPLYKDMYVKEYLTYVAKIFDVPNMESRVKEMIELTGLGQEQDKKIFQLSKGYKQRVGIAQAMIHNPEVLVLDEPTSGLDPNQLDEIRKLIVKIGKEKTVLLSTHIMQEVEAMCERVIIINKGEIVADNTSKNLKAASGMEIIVIVEFKDEIDSQILRGIHGVDNVVQKTNTIFHMYTKDPRIDLRQDIFNLAVKNNWTILNLQKEEKDLEIVFKELTKS